jgi:hypothetical protein
VDTFGISIWKIKQLAAPPELVFVRVVRQQSPPPWADGRDAFLGFCNVPAGGLCVKNPKIA